MMKVEPWIIILFIYDDDYYKAQYSYNLTQRVHDTSGVTNFAQNMCLNVLNQLMLQFRKL